MSDQFPFESGSITNLLNRLGLESGPHRNPNSPGVETGIDVDFMLGDKRIGAQLTAYHWDASPDIKGSPSWNAEKKLHRATRGNYGYHVTAEYIDPLKHLVSGKVARARDFNYDAWDQVWLVVVPDPRDGSVVTTFIAAEKVFVDDLTKHISPLLDGSDFDGVFFVVHLGQAVFGWSQDEGWRKLRDKDQAETGPDMFEMLHKMFRNDTGGNDA